MIELLGSDIQTMKSGESAIIVFGNKYTQKLAEKTVNKFWKNKINLLEVGKIFESVMEQVALETPSVSPEHDMIIKYPKIGLKMQRNLFVRPLYKMLKNFQCGVISSKRTWLKHQKIFKWQLKLLLKEMLVL